MMFLPEWIFCGGGYVRSQLRSNRIAIWCGANHFQRRTKQSWRCGKAYETGVLSCDWMAAADRRHHHHAHADPDTADRRGAVPRRLRDPLQALQGLPPLPAIYAASFRMVLQNHREHGPPHAHDGEAHDPPHQSEGACAADADALAQEGLTWRSPSSANSTRSMKAKCAFRRSSAASSPTIQGRSPSRARVSISSARMRSR